MDYYITLPSRLEGFHNDETTEVQTVTGREMYLLKGTLAHKDGEEICPHCGHVMHRNDTHQENLRHICYGHTLLTVQYDKTRYFCPQCHKTAMQEVPFKSDGHRITKQLKTYTEDLLRSGLTNKEVSELTGLGKNVVKEIDMARLQEKYCDKSVDGTYTLKKPTGFATFIGIDEFKLHDGHKYAVVIVDMLTGHVIWLAHGKKKAVVYNFIEHVGLDWMSHVKAVACDMNLDFQEAFEEMCPHLRIVFDRFHLIKNLNDKVVSAVRKDEQKRLIAEKRYEEAKALKSTKYILTSSREELRRKDAEARDGKVIVKECTKTHFWVLP